MSTYLFKDPKIGKFDQNISVQNGQLVSIIGDSSNITVQYNNLNNSKSYLLGTNLNANIINNDITSGTFDANSVYLYNNSIVYNDTINNTSEKNREFNLNNFLNFPNLNVLIKPNSNEFLSYLPINNVETVNYFYIKNNVSKYYPNNVLTVSPKFLNDGQRIIWGESTNQTVLYNLIFTITDETSLNEFIEILKNIPKNLNNNVLDITLNLSGNLSSDFTLEFSNFFGGIIKIHGKEKDENGNPTLTLNHIDSDTFPTLSNNVIKNINFNFDNCTNINIENLILSGSNLSFTNCNRVFFNNNIYINNTNAEGLIFDCTAAYLTNSFLSYNDTTINEYKIFAKNNSRVYVDPTVYTFYNNNRTDNTNYKLFKKAKLDGNSIVSWYTDRDNVVEVTKNTSAEFVYDTSDISGITDLSGIIDVVSAMGIANHTHHQVLFTGYDPDVEDSDNEIDAMLPGSTFYWPRAIKTKYDVVSTILDGTTEPEYQRLSGLFQSFPPATDDYINAYKLSGGYNISGVASGIISLIPFVSGRNSIR